MAKVGADFAWRMEDVLDTYAHPYDVAYPVICFDEKSYQLQDHVNAPQPAAPGRLRRIDYEYKRCGTANLFMAFEPLTGQRCVSVTERRGNAEFTAQMQCLHLRYPHAAKIRVVLDQLSTHSPAAFYQYLPPDEARQLTQRFEWIYTPKHASWLNMAEMEWSVLERQCLGQRLHSEQALIDQVTAWQSERNRQVIAVNWQFSAITARQTMTRHYPSRI